MIVRIAYPGAESRQILKDGKRVEMNPWDENLRMYGEIKRLQLVLADTREKFARRDDVKDDIDRIVQSLIRLEDKIDRVLSSKEK